MDLRAIHAAALRAQSAYIMDAAKAQAAFEALGYHWIGQFKDGDSQAVLTRDDSGAVYLSISGTRFSDRQFGDLLDDIDLRPVDVGDGAKVTRGAYEACIEIWAWAKSQVPDGTVFNVEGHSLGGWRTSYTPLFLPAAQIGKLHCFEPPKGANAAYYARFAAELANMVIVANGRDIWFGYPRADDVFKFLPFVIDWIHRPGDVMWLQATGGYSTIQAADWPGGFDQEDHSIDLVVERLTALVESQPKAA
jgi:hypothetical protein